MRSMNGSLQQAGARWVSQPDEGSQAGRPVASLTTGAVASLTPSASAAASGWYNPPKLGAACTIRGPNKRKNGGLLRLARFVNKVEQRAARGGPSKKKGTRHVGIFGETLDHRHFRRTYRECCNGRRNRQPCAGRHDPGRRGRTWIKSRIPHVRGAKQRCLPIFSPVC